MRVRDLLDAVTEAIRLTDRVERLQQDVDKLADAFVTDSRERDRDVRNLDRRVQKIENLIEFTEKTAVRKLQQSKPKK